MVQKFMVEKSGVEKFMLEKSGVKRSGLKLGVEKFGVEMPFNGISSNQALRLYGIFKNKTYQSVIHWWASKW